MKNLEKKMSKLSEVIKATLFVAGEGIEKENKETEEKIKPYIQPYRLYINFPTTSFGRNSHECINRSDLWRFQCRCRFGGRRSQ